MQCQRRVVGVSQHDNIAAQLLQHSRQPKTVRVAAGCVITAAGWALCSEIPTTSQRHCTGTSHAGQLLRLELIYRTLYGSTL